MRDDSSFFPLAPWLKALVLVVALAGLARVAGQALAPTVPVSTLLLYALGGSVVALLAVAGAAWLLGGLGHGVLRRGGTDVQWLDLPSDPPGLSRPDGPVGRTPPDGPAGDRARPARPR